MKIHNVGYGANVIEHNDKIYLFDVGSRSVAQEKVIPFLKRYYPHVNKIETIFISHYHFNHIHGVVDVSEEYEIGGIYTNGTYSNDQGERYIERDPLARLEVEAIIDQNNIPNESYKVGDIFNLDGFTMTAWSPLEQYASNFDAYTENPNGLTGGIMCLEYGNFRALFGGDVTQENELLEVLGEINDTEINVWFAPHHGDPIAIKESILSKLKPNLVVLESLGRSSQSVETLNDFNVNYMWMNLHERSSVEVKENGDFINLTPDNKEYYSPKGKFFMV